jgi:hypothetical protein
MDKLQDALADQKEIEDAMQVNQTLIEASLEIDEELEEELEALLEQENAISTPEKQPVSQPVTESTSFQPIKKSTAKKIDQPDKTPVSTLQSISNVTEDKELEELERMFAELEALPSPPQHTPRTTDSKSKQREEMILTSE